MKVLVVDDEHKIVNSIKKGLLQEGFLVDIAYSGSEGYDLASTEDYDVIILDLMLPEINGIEICKKLRKGEIHTPILILTAKWELEDKITGLNSGADDYITKPFAFEELLASIRALTRRPQNLTHNTLNCGDLSLDTLKFKVSRSGKDIRLSKKEYALLEYMLRNKGDILTKDQIISHVWDYDSDILQNTVEQYIRYLRTKIDNPLKKSSNLIQTVRGFGYKISDR